MTAYTLFNNITAVQNAPGTTQGNLGVPANVPPGSLAAQMFGGAGSLVAPPAGQAFSLQVDGIGSVSATAQVWASNDGVNWVTYGSAITASSVSGAGTNTATGTGNFQWYTAQLTAISGTQANATLTMNA